MSIDQLQEGRAQLEVRNVGGIDETTATFEPGVTVLAGQNATNRTSLLQALMGVLGSDDVSIKGDAEEAFVELSIGEETYTRQFRRRSGGAIEADGDPYLDDSTLSDLFAFLLESNEARRAVAAEDDLRDIIMRPIDTDEIEAEIDRLLSMRRELEDHLEELDDLKNRLPSLEEKRTRLRDEIDETETELQGIEAELQSRDADVEQSREEKAELETKLSELGGRRETLETVRYELETERDSLESLRNEKRDLERERASLSEEPIGDIESIERRIERLRDRKERLETEVGDLQSVIQFNEEMLETAGDDLLEGGNSDSGAVTDKLLPDGTVQCWTCGSEVETGEIEATIDHLRERSKRKLDEISDVESELEELKERSRELESEKRRRREIKQRLEELDSEIETTEATIERLTERREELREEIETIEREIERLEDDTYEEILSLHREANELEYELGRLETDLEDVEAEIADVEDRIAREDDLETRREEINEELESLRTKIERTERQAIEEFNDHMETVLDLLDYENLDRIWLERTERDVRKGRRTVTESHFELHIVRRTESGTTYEDTVEHLSESEREVTGLVFALAGYLAHDVHEEVPFMLLDSLEAIDSERIARLVDYLEGHAPYLVVALLEEDAAALDDSYARIRDI